MRKKTQKVCLEKGVDAFYTTKKSCKAAVSKKRVLKIMGASGLALIMGIGTLCGVLIAPLGTSGATGATSASNSGDLAAFAQSTDRTQNEGLIIPQKDDPVLFTTKSGIEIKISNSDLVDGLSDYPYFTTTGTGGIYHWVVIGLSEYLPSIVVVPGADSFSSFFECQTPAGLATLSDSLSSVGVWDNIVCNPDEIPSGCVLCILNGTAGYEQRTSSGGGCGAGELSTKTGCSLEELGLSTIRSQIIPTTVKRRNWDGAVSTQQNLTLFSMGSSYSTTFKLGTYLTSTQLKLSVSFWSGDNSNNSSGGYYFNANGDVKWGFGNIALRPAFVLSLV